MEVRELISTFGEDEVKGWFMNYELSDFLTDEEIQVITERGTWSKEKLCQRIIDHYFTREIGTDAIGQHIFIPCTTILNYLYLFRCQKLREFIIRKPTFYLILTKGRNQFS